MILKSSHKNKILKTNRILMMMAFSFFIRYNLYYFQKPIISTIQNNVFSVGSHLPYFVYWKKLWMYLTRQVNKNASIPRQTLIGILSQTIKMEPYRKQPLAVLYHLSPHRSLLHLHQPCLVWPP